MAKPRGGEAEATIIIRRPRKAGGAHHSSGWKIAFADFMTAMMALFIVLWALGQDSSTKENIALYFSNPVGLKKGYSGGKSPIAVGATPARMQTAVPMEVMLRGQIEQMQKVGDRIKEQLNGSGALGKVQTQVEIVASREGLRIELREAGGGETFFPFGSAVMKPVTQQALAVIARELSVLPNPVIVEGHTDAAPFGSRGGYSNWELSSDRAHAARRVLEANGIGYDRIKEVRGYADKHLRVPANPLDPSNRRITVLLPLVQPAPASAPAAASVKEPARTL